MGEPENLSDDSPGEYFITWTFPNKVPDLRGYRFRRLLLGEDCPPKDHAYAKYWGHDPGNPFPRFVTEDTEPLLAKLMRVWQYLRSQTPPSTDAIKIVERAYEKTYHSSLSLWLDHLKSEHKEALRKQFKWQYDPEEQTLARIQAKQLSKFLLRFAVYDDDRELTETLYRSERECLHKIFQFSVPIAVLARKRVNGIYQQTLAYREVPLCPPLLSNAYNIWEGSGHLLIPLSEAEKKYPGSRLSKAEYFAWQRRMKREKERQRIKAWALTHREVSQRVSLPRDLQGQPGLLAHFTVPQKGEKTELLTRSVYEEAPPIIQPWNVPLYDRRNGMATIANIPPGEVKKDPKGATKVSIDNHALLLTSVSKEFFPRDKAQLQVCFPAIHASSYTVVEHTRGNGQKVPAEIYAVYEQPKKGEDEYRPFFDNSESKDEGFLPSPPSSLTAKERIAWHDSHPFGKITASLIYDKTSDSWRLVRTWQARKEREEDGLIYKSRKAAQAKLHLFSGKAWQARNGSTSPLDGALEYCAKQGKAALTEKGWTQWNAKCAALLMAGAKGNAYIGSGPEDQPEEDTRSGERSEENTEEMNHKPDSNDSSDDEFAELPQAETQIVEDEKSGEELEEVIPELSTALG